MFGSDGFVRGRAGPAEAEQVVEAEAARPAIGAFRAVALAALLVALALSRTLASLAVAAGAARVAVAGRARTRAPGRAGSPVARRVLLRVHDAVVRLVDAVHALGRCRVVRIQVRMVLPRLLAVGLLHFVGRRVLAHAQHGIRVIGHDAHVPPRPSSCVGRCISATRRAYSTLRSRCRSCSSGNFSNAVVASPMIADKRRLQVGGHDVERRKRVVAAMLLVVLEVARRVHQVDEPAQMPPHAPQRFRPGILLYDEQLPHQMAEAAGGLVGRGRVRLFQPGDGGKLVLDGGTLPWQAFAHLTVRLRQRRGPRPRRHVAVVMPVVPALVVGQGDGQVGGVTGEAGLHEVVRRERVKQAPCLVLGFFGFVERSVQQHQKRHVVGEREAAPLPATAAQRAAQPAVGGAVPHLFLIAGIFQVGDEVPEHGQRPSRSEKSRSARKPVRMVANVSGDSASKTGP